MSMASTPPKDERPLLVVTRRDPEKFVGGDTLRLSRILDALGGGRILIPSLRQPRDDGGPGCATRSFPLSALDIPVILLLIIRGYPIQAAMFYRRGLKRYLGTLDLSKTRVLLHTSRLALNIPARKLPQVVLELTDFIGGARYEKLSFRGLVSQGVGPALFKELLLRGDKRRMIRFETSLVGKVEQTVVISEFEVERLRALCGPKAKVSALMHPIGGASREIRFLPADEKRHDFVMAGNWDTFPNKKMLDAFLEDLRPRLERTVGPLSVAIVGPGAVNPNSLTPRDRHLGVVDDLTAALQTGKFGIALISNASGIQNKVLDYIASGVMPICSDTVLAPLPERIASVCVRLDESNDVATLTDLLEHFDERYLAFQAKIAAWDGDHIIGHEFNNTYSRIVHG